MLACVSTTAASPRAMIEKDLPDSVWVAVSYTHLTLPTNREV